MDINYLDDLENKVLSLMTLLEDTRHENSSLKQEISEKNGLISEYESENSQLKQELDSNKNDFLEQQSKLDSVAERIQGIISQLDSVN